ncbi:hypothetical protein [Pyrodictium abyssi]|uniref:DUF1640 domain-containing protein n=1 Tax=Pyrodictium abyssi TaxID=54256 RepID=A0ABN6ZM19_9CREN|nr:hypothetical protein PABY_00260 [Pyrodictium abyssi]
MESLASKLLREARERPEEWRRLAERIAADIAGDERLRLALLNAVLRETATRRDIAELRAEIDREIDLLRGDFEKLRGEVEGLRRELREEMKELRSLYKWIIGLLVALMASLIGLVLPITLRALGLM